MRCNLSLKIVVSIVVASLSSAASAWNPNAGAEPTSAYDYPQSNMPNNVVPQRYYTNQGLAPLPPAAAYMPQPVANPAPPTYPATAYPSANYPAPPQAPMQPVAGSVISPPPASPAGYATYQPTAGAMPAPVNPAPISNAATYPAYTAPAPIQYAPAPIQAASIPLQSPPIAVADAPTENNLMRSRAPTKRTHYSIGGEVFYDNYQEPDAFPELHSDAYYGALNGSITYDMTPRWFGALDARASYGSEDYSSSSGTIKGVPQLELESRVMAGYNGLLNSGSRIKPYLGLGVRYYLDQGDGEVTSLGAAGYDRSILQFYAPIGVSYEFQTDGLTIVPNIEIDPLLYGTVESRLSSVAGYSNANNTQTKGLGWRAEIMVSKLHDNGTGWQFGPFIRYWNIEDSNTDTVTTPSGPSAAIEPKNTRMQLGTKLKYLF